MLSRVLKNKSFQIGAALLATVVGAGVAYYLQKNKKKSHIIKLLDQYNKIDSSSLSNIDSVKCLHYDLILSINFEKKNIEGSVNYHFEVIKNTKRVILDIRNLSIKNVIMDGIKLKSYFLVTEDKFKNIGQQLQIFLPKKYEAGSKFELTVQYETTESKESGLNWLNPSQTEGKTHPYLFTQSEPIWNRTIFPCQDTPAIKSTFSAQLNIPKPLKAYCSGRLLNKQETEHETIMHFKQDIPIPSYLFAIVAGNLEERKVSERTSVISEPEVIERYSKELEDMETQLKALEEIITPYDWQEYKVAVLPASFPYGGMENPLLTFASPSIIVGDKSGTDVIIHEMAHSWSGNLFSCKNWNSFWINEGWTVYFECEAIRKLKGEEEYQIKFCLLDNDLKSTIDSIGHDHTYTTLNPTIGINNPDDAFSRVPYVRGMQLLTHLSNVVGKDNFVNFSRDFVNHFQYKSLNTEEFKEYFKSQFGLDIYNKIDWDAWINKPGYPPQVFETKCEGVEKPKRAAEDFLKNAEVSKQVWEAFSVQQKIIFLQEVGKKDQLSLEKVKYLDETLELVKVTNPEIYTQWFTIALKIKYDEVIPLVVDHLSKHGRMKFVRSIYKLLDAYDHKLAVDTFLANESLYYGFCHSLVKADLKL